jgi:hypothetical protein
MFLLLIIVVKNFDWAAKIIKCSALGAGLYKNYEEKIEGVISFPKHQTINLVRFTKGEELPFC